MPIGKVVLRTCPHLTGDATPDKVPSGEYERCGGLLREIRQYARSGKLQLCGRHHATPGSEDHTVLSEIPAEFWEKGNLGYMDFLKDGKGRAERTIHPNGMKEWYSDIWLNEGQVNRIYPARSRLRLQKPWKRAA